MSSSFRFRAREEGEGLGLEYSCSWMMLNFQVGRVLAKLEKVHLLRNKVWSNVMILLTEVKNKSQFDNLPNKGTRRAHPV